MNLLNRKLFRDLWQAKGQFLSALIIVIIGVSFYSGINASLNDLTFSSVKYYQDYRFGDLWAYFHKAPENLVDKLSALPYVVKATGRIVEDVKLGGAGENVVIRLITLPDTKKDIVNDVMITSGTYFSNSDNNQCLVEDGFFKANNLKIGDTIDPIVNGNQVKLKVIGSVISPEYVYSLKDGSEVMPDNKKFGIVYLKQSFGQAVLGFKGSINNISFILSKGTDPDKAKDDIKKAVKDYGVTDLVKRADQLSNSMIDAGFKKLKSTGGAFPVIFFIVAAVIIYITMGRMVENQRSQIGVLKAFGFSNSQVLMHYLSFSIVIAILGSIIGSDFGCVFGERYVFTYEYLLQPASNRN